MRTQEKLLIIIINAIIYDALKLWIVLLKQLEFILREGDRENAPRFSLGYALFVYVKALYHFYVSDISRELYDRLKNIGDTAGRMKKNAVRQFRGHPWELIYKYLALIARQKNDTESFGHFRSEIIAIGNTSSGIIGTVTAGAMSELDGGSQGDKLTYMFK